MGSLLPRGWRVPVLLLLIVIAGLGIALAYGSGDEPSPAPAAAPAEPVKPAADPLAEREKQRLDEHLVAYGSGYDCAANQGVTRINDLKLCPDYTATVVFGDGKPVITEAGSDGDSRPITITVKPEEVCGNDGVETLPVTCTDYWRVTWRVADGYVPLGYNQQMAPDVMYRPDGSDWVGPLGFEQEHTTLVDAKTVAVEIYAGDPKLSTSPDPLPQDKQRWRN